PYAIGEFRALLNASQVVEEPGTKANIGKPTEDGYDAVAQRLLARADLLIAVWDGKGSRGRGGSVEVIEAAQKKRIPVIWIHARKAQSPRLLPPLEPAHPLPRQVAMARRRIAARPR